MMSRARRALLHAALGEKHRLEVVDLLIQGDLSVQEIEPQMEMPGNLLARHLNFLGGLS